MALNYALYNNNRLYSKSQAKTKGALILTIIMILFIGLRPLSGVFVDMKNYNVIYQMKKGVPYDYTLDTDNFLFDNLLFGLSSHAVDITVFFIIIAVIYFGGIYLACKKLFPKDTLYTIIIYLAAFSTFSYGTNGIKAGAAASLFLCAIAYKEKVVPCIIFLILSLGFHHSMVMPIAAFVICLLYRKPKAYIMIWSLCVLIAAAHISFFQNIFASMSDDIGAGYLSEDESGYRTGFRLDFIIYSAAPVIWGYCIMSKYNYKSDFYRFIYCIYTLTNSIWMLCMYASFTNRIAYLSWLLYPIVLIYPYFDKPFIKNQYKSLNIVAGCHLGFTLAMTIIYYGLLDA